MKLYKIFVLFLFISSFFISAQSAQEITLDKLFDQLIKTNDSNKAELDQIRSNQIKLDENKPNQRK